MANITAKVEIITPEMAKCYLEHNEGNRNINKGAVAFLAKMMQEGTWQLNGESIVFDKNGRLVNGQHRLSACVYANVPFESMVVRGVEEETFYTFDTGRARTSADCFKISNIPNGTSVTSIISKYFQAKKAPKQNTMVRSQGNNVKSYSSNKSSNGEILDEYKANPEYWQNIYSYADACYRRCRLLTKGYVGGMTAYLNIHLGYELGFVMNFFEQIFFEEKTEMSVLATMRRKLVDDAMKGGNMKMSDTYKEQLLIKCWESYKNGKDLTLLRWQPNVETERRFE